jgi:hypothetical protein
LNLFCTVFQLVFVHSVFLKALNKEVCMEVMEMLHLESVLGRIV